LRIYILFVKHVGVERMVEIRERASSLVRTGKHPTAEVGHEETQVVWKPPSRKMRARSPSVWLRPDLVRRPCRAGVGRHSGFISGPHRLTAARSGGKGESRRDGPVGG
jgi:hypothetical protein